MNIPAWPQTVTIDVAAAAAGEGRGERASSPLPVQAGGWIALVVCVAAFVALVRPLPGHRVPLDDTLLHALNHAMARIPFIGLQTTLLGIDVPQLFLASAAVALWFRRPVRQEFRGSVLVAFAAFFPTYVLARVLEHVGHRVRPLVGVPLQPLGDPAAFHQTQSAMSHWGSFPSDHAALWAIAVVVAFSVGRRAGFVFLAVGLYLCALRIAFGYHWPSDIAGGAVLGTAIILVLLRIAAACRPAIDRVLAVSERHASFAAVVAFVLLSEFANAFHFTQMIASSLHGRIFH